MSECEKHTIREYVGSGICGLCEKERADELETRLDELRGVTRSIMIALNNGNDIQPGSFLHDEAIGAIKPE